MSSNNSATATVGVNTAPAALNDSVPLNSPTTEIDINVLTNDTDPNSGDTLTISSVTSPAHGTATIVAGKVRYVLTDTTFIGTDSFSYTVCDGRTGCDTSTVNVLVNNHRSSDLRVTHGATPALVQGSSATAITWTATVTNNGPDDEPNPVLIESLPSGVTGISAAGATCTTVGATLTCPLPALISGAARTVTFTGTLPAGASDPSVATASVSGDGADPSTSNNSATASVAINTPPTATGDLASLNSPATQIDINVLSNDTEPDAADALTITGVTVPAHGTATIVSGKVRYVLTDLTFIGVDTFTYTVCDGRSGCDTATVTVPVNDHRRANLALTQTSTPKVIQRGGPSTVVWTATVTNNGPQAEPSPVLIEDLPAGVTGVSVAGATCSSVGTSYTCPLPALANGASVVVTFTATLPSGAPDPVTATATASGSIADPDASDNTATGTVGVNLPPTAVNDSANLAADKLSVDIDAAGNDTDPDADPLTVTSMTSPSHGTATIVGGKIRYTLTDYSFFGIDTFTYRVCDGRSGCASATVIVTVSDHDVADLAVAQVAQPKLLQRNGSRVATWVVTVSNKGPHTEPKPVLVQTLPAGSTVISASLDGCSTSGLIMTCVLSELPNGESTEVTFTATLPADAPDQPLATAVVSGDSVDPKTSNNTAKAGPVMNTRPIAAKDSGYLPSAVLRVNLDVLGNDTDADGDPLTVKSGTKPQHGTVAIVNGKVRYTLTDLDFVGVDSFEYRVCDDRSGCTTAVASILVDDHRHAPGAVADKASVVSGKTAMIDVTANDRDADGDELKLKITKGPEHGTATVKNGRIRYTPKDGYLGPDTITYQVCDASGLCDAVKVTVAVTSRPPVAAPDADTVRPGGTTVVDVLSNDVDPDGYTLGSVEITRQPRAGGRQSDLTARSGTRPPVMRWLGAR